MCFLLSVCSDPVLADLMSRPGLTPTERADLKLRTYFLKKRFLLRVYNILWNTDLCFIHSPFSRMLTRTHMHARVRTHTRAQARTHAHTHSLSRMHACTNTAWDSEIESLTSLIKLHQNERRSAPCGQIGAATEPVLATSPTLKKF